MRFSKELGGVIGAGLLTSIVTLVVVYLLGKNSFNVMGFYLWFIVPIGAGFAGAVAGSGYGIAARLLGVRVVTLALVAIGVAQLLFYFGAKYAEYMFVFDSLRANAEFMAATAVNPEAAAILDMSFFSYFDFNTRSFAFDEESSGFGAFGYAFRALEIAGFVGGGIIPIVTQKGAAYCDACEQYMKTVRVATFPASLPPAKVKKKDIEGHEVEAARQEQIFEEAHRHAEHFLQGLDVQSPEAIVGALQEISAFKAQNPKSGPVNLDISKTACTGCGEGTVKLSRITVVGDQTNVDVVAVLPTNANLDAAMSIVK